MAEARSRRLTPAGKVLLDIRELASDLSPYGPEPPSEELLGRMLALPLPDRTQLAEIIGGKPLEAAKRMREHRTEC